MNDTADLDWNAVRAFAAVARHGTLTAAAAALGVSQPTLGRHIDALEARLATTLFVRGRGGMVPTEAGAALLASAEAMRVGADALLLAASGRRAAREGTVRVTASRIVATHILPPVVAGIVEAEPGIEVEVVATDAVSDLLARDADIAVRMVRPAQDDLIATRVGTLRIGAFAAPRYLERHGPVESTPADLLAHRLVGYDRSALIVDAMRAGGIAVSRSDFAVRTDDQVLYARLVAAGAGIGFLAEVVTEVAADGLVALPALDALPGGAPSLPVWLAAHRALRTAPAIRFVHDALKAGLAAALTGDKERSGV